MSDRMESWPPLDQERVSWDVHPVTGMGRQDRQWIGRDYHAAIVPRIADRTPTISAEVAALAEESAVEMTRFDQELGHRLSGFAAVLLRSEAASSSQIEGITAGARAIVEAEVAGSGSGNAARVVANTAAMREALALAGALDEERILAMHQTLLGRSDERIAGRFRDDQVWIGWANVPHRADFVPPTAPRVPAAMADLVAFMARDDLPVMVQAAIAHAQFETIHPFSDGNGRVGRALIHALMASKDLVRNAAIPVSAGLLIRRPAYIEALTAYRQGRLDPMVEELARAGLLAAAEGRTLVADTESVREQWRQMLAGVRSDSAVHRLADGLLAQPVVSVHEVRQILGQEHNVHRHIDALVDKGILKARQDYRTRTMTWRAQDVLDVLDDYAARIGRRTH